MRKALPMSSLRKRPAKPDGKVAKHLMEVEEAALQAVAVHPSSMARQVTETNKIIREGLLRDSSSEKVSPFIFFVLKLFSGDFHEIVLDVEESDYLIYSNNGICSGRRRVGARTDGCRGDDRHTEPGSIGHAVGAKSI